MFHHLYFVEKVKTIFFNKFNYNNISLISQFYYLSKWNRIKLRNCTGFDLKSELNYEFSNN